MNGAFHSLPIAHVVVLVRRFEFSILVSKEWTCDRSRGHSGSLSTDFACGYERKGLTVRLRSSCLLPPYLFRFFVLTLAVGIPALVIGCGGGSSTGGSSGGGTTPTISSISPATATAGSGALAITVSGSGFATTSVVQVGGTSEATTYVSGTQLTATVPASQLASGAQLAVVVLNGSLSSTPMNLVVDNPAPTIASLSPAVEAIGATSPLITLTGTGFVPTTVINVNGAARTTAFTSSTAVSVSLTAADVSAAGSLSLTAVNPTPGGGTSSAASLAVVSPTPTPVIAYVDPTSIVAGSGDTIITVIGAGFNSSTVIQWNGTALPTGQSLPYFYGGSEVFATVPAADLTKAGTGTVTVDTPSANPPLSNSVTVTITNPPAPTLTQLSPSSGPINTATEVTLWGSGFTAQSTVSMNGAVIASTFVSSTELQITIPASTLLPSASVSFTVTTPAPGGGTTSPLSFSPYIAIPNNDIAYNAADGLLYVSVPIDGNGVTGNSVAGIDPVSGNVMRQIWVGSNPNKLALSTDGTQLFVGLDGAAAVAQVNLTTGVVVNQFSLGGGSGVYDPPYTAAYLAAVPGLPNSVAVATAGYYGGGTGVTIYDSGVARAQSSTNVGEGPLSFGSSASTLYLAASAIEELTLNSTGITGATSLSTSTGYTNSIQYDNGELYLSSGQVVNASTGALSGTFYATANTAASGPIVSDSTLGRAFVGESSYISGYSVLAFDESSFNLIGSIPVNGVGAFNRIVRWGQNGVALNAASGTNEPTGQIFILQSTLVKDLSSSPADLSVALTAPATTTTGTTVSWTATVKNLGPNPAEGATLAMSLDSSLIINSVTPGQGTCGTGPSFICDLGSIADGTSVTVTVSATPTIAGTLAGTASVSSTSSDPVLTNNQSTTSTTVTGSLYGAVPVVSAISPNLVQAGSADFTLTVTGNGFNADSTVNLGATALATTYVSATQLTASVTASEIANYGWAPVTVSNSSPGGGVSQVVPLTIYDLVNVPASGLVFDPFSQSLYATLPGTATNITGNSVVAINPVTGAVGTPIAVGSQPTAMAETSDGNYLYIGLSGADSLALFNLLQQTVTATIPLSYTQYGTTTSTPATSLAVMPGTDSTLAVGISNGWGNFGIFDISGNNGTFRKNFSGIYEGVNPQFANATELYAYDSQTSGAEFYRYSVDANGLTLIDGTTLDGMGGFSGGFDLAGGLVYGGSGGIANPSTTPPSQIATLAPVQQTSTSIGGNGVVADPSLQEEFLMANGLTRYNLTTYLPEATLVIPVSNSGVFEATWTMLRWGQDGLALMASGEDYSTDQPFVLLMLLRGPFVAPQELVSNSAANLASSSAATIAHGSGNTMLTLTGSNFIPGVAVTWNGSYRTTTIVDATHLSVAIPASDLTAAGTASLVATNPGAKGSSALEITIN